MTFGSPALTAAVGAFLLAFPALFSIVNPIGGALIFNNVTTGRTPHERRALAARIGGYSLLILIGSLLLGSYILNFLGVSLAAVRIAGGAVVAFRAWGLLNEPEAHEDRKAGVAAPAQDAEDVAFFPLTMPFTTGPGTISVAIALSSQRPDEAQRLAPFFAGCSLAALGVSAAVWLSYSSSDVVMRLLGPSGARVVSRLVAFLLLCVGVQIMLTGLQDIIGKP
jgi:multiple antibiotic resistance protein